MCSDEINHWHFEVKAFSVVQIKALLKQLEVYKFSCESEKGMKEVARQKYINVNEIRIPW